MNGVLVVVQFPWAPISDLFVGLLTVVLLFHCIRVCPKCMSTNLEAFISPTFVLSEVKRMAVQHCSKQIDPSDSSVNVSVYLLGPFVEFRLHK